MLPSPPKPSTAVLLASSALSLGVASALLASCSKVVTIDATPTSLEWTAAEFDGAGPVSHSTMICYTGPGVAQATVEPPAPFTLASGESSEQFTLADGVCYELFLSLDEPAELAEDLDVVVAGDLISGTVVVELTAQAAEDSGSADGTDTDGTDDTDTDTDTDGGDTDTDTDTDTDGGDTDTDGGDTDTDTDGGDTGGSTSPCPDYSGLGTTLTRSYETSDSYRKSSGMSGTMTLTVDGSDPAAPEVVITTSLTDRAGNTTESTERQSYTCDTTGSFLSYSEVEGTVFTHDGDTQPFSWTDTYSNDMTSMVPGFGDGANVADTFTFERVEDGRTDPYNGSNVVTSSGAATTSTPAGSFSTYQVRIQYAEASDVQDYTAYLDAELGMVKSFYWELVSVE